MTKQERLRLYQLALSKIDEWIGRHGFCSLLSSVGFVYSYWYDFNDQLPELLAKQPEIWYGPSYWFAPGDREPRRKILEEIILEMTIQQSKTDTDAGNGRLD